VVALERADPEELSPALQVWLGRPLTDQDREFLANERNKTGPVDWKNVDTIGWSKEQIKWWHER
jgi:hypothetical protein